MTDDLRERIARIVDPEAWAVADAVQREIMAGNPQRPADWRLTPSLVKADAILSSLPTPAPADGEWVTLFAPTYPEGTYEALDPLARASQASYAIEGVLTMRAHAKRLDGYTLEASVECAEAVRAILAASPAPLAVEPPYRHVDDYNDPVLIGLAREFEQAELAAMKEALEALMAVCTADPKRLPYPIWGSPEQSLAVDKAMKAARAALSAPLADGGVGMREALEAFRDVTKPVMLALLNRGRAELLLADKVHKADDKARAALSADGGVG